MAAGALQFYTQRCNELDPGMRFGERDACAFGTERMTIVASAQESMELVSSSAPAIVIAASGMATGGRVLHHLAAGLPNSNNTVLFVGYQSAGTRGRQLCEGARHVKIQGQEVPVAARVERLDSMSAHADVGEIMRWLAGFSRAPTITYLVHGEPAALRRLAHGFTRSSAGRFTSRNTGEGEFTRHRVRAVQGPSRLRRPQVGWPTRPRKARGTRRVPLRLRRRCLLQPAAGPALAVLKRPMQRLMLVMIALEALAAAAGSRRGQHGCVDHHGADCQLDSRLLEQVDEAAVVQRMPTGSALPSKRRRSSGISTRPRSPGATSTTINVLSTAWRCATCSGIVTHLRASMRRRSRRSTATPKLFWLNSGPFNNLTARKFVLRCTPDAFAAAAAAGSAGAAFPQRNGETLDQLLTR
jgi:hypothetical protein